MEIKNRHHLRNDEAEDVKAKLINFFEKDFLGNKKLEKGEIGGEEVVLVDGRPLLSKFGETFFPNVLGALELDLGSKRSLVVDQGAVPHVINGADIMAPGVVEADDSMKEGDLALVREKEHDKALAVVKMLVNAKGALELEEGKVAENLHHLRDDFWEVIGGTG